MRAVKTVISTAGNLKREQPHMDEELLCLRALCDVNVPKLVDEDLALFQGIVTDLFPRTRQGHAPCHAPSSSQGALEDALRVACLSRGLQDDDGGGGRLTFE
ncbi:dynein axonemal heavy chain 1-like [Petromyzon marinus]|uniref:dynein axonemal heavy chain 1-like n=1 Tax=Petromyzon marinus TaxID=7757 RepID=UPI003F7249A5